MCARFFCAQLGYSFGRLPISIPIAPIPSHGTPIFKLMPNPSDLDPQGTATAREKTAARLKGANSGPNGTTIDPQALQ